MKKITVLCILLLSFTTNILAQIQFAPNTNTTYADISEQGVELPGNRYAFAILQKQNLLQVSSSNGLLLITDSMGNVIHQKAMLADSFLMLIPSNLFYKDNKLYLTSMLGNDSGGRVMPTVFRFSILDTMLNVINEQDHPRTDSNRFMFDNYACMLHNKIYNINDYMETSINNYNIRKASVDVYDLMGNLVATRAIDTVLFPPLAGSYSYAMDVNDITDNGLNRIFIVFWGAKLDSNLGSNYYETYIIALDTMLNLKEWTKVGCLDINCQNSFFANNIKFQGYDNNLGLLAGIVVNKFSTNQNINSLVKLNIPTSPPSNYLYTNNILNIADSLYGPTDVKSTGRKNVAVKNNRFFFVGHDFYDYLNPLSTQKNTLVVTCTDTNLNVIWSRHVGGDMYYLPENIFATSDGGCIVLATRYDSNLPNNQYDHYIFKLDGNGLFLAVNELIPESEKLVKVYPNPAKDVLHFQMKESGNYQLNIMDMNGKIIASQLFSGNKTTINISELPPGIYNYSIKSDGNKTYSGLWLKR